MRKKSHISLAKYLVASVDIMELKVHKKAFFVGSVLPDCKPSFLTRRHEFDETFEWLKDAIRDLTDPERLSGDGGQAYWRKLGEVLHYVADYFTYPHNSVFGGTLREHCSYENWLKHCLRYSITSDRVTKKREELRIFSDEEQLFRYIESRHREYLDGSHNVEKDIRYITSVTLQVMIGIYQIYLQRVEEYTYAAA